MVKTQDEPPVLDFQLTVDQWLRFERAMELCSRITGAPATPEKCLELMCQTYLIRKGRDAPAEPRKRRE